MKYLHETYKLLDFAKIPKSDIAVDTFVITRFNLRLWSKDKHNRPTLSKEWLEQRFDLFEKYCYPSVMHQSSQNFLWVCLFDEDATLPYLNKVKKYIDDFPYFLPLFLDEKDSSMVSECIVQTIMKYKNGSDCLITIRLDNDDALGVDFIKKVREYATRSTGTSIYSFKYGIQYFVQNKLAVHIPFYNNHFLSMVNMEFKKEDFCSRKVKHVLEFNHFDTENYPYPFVCNTTDRDMWAEVIHATNVSNDCKMTLHQGPVQKSTFLIDNFYMVGQEFVLPYVSKIKFWRFMVVRFLKHIMMKISSKL